MDLSSFSTVGTQTPTEDRVFEFPECFSPSPVSRSSVSSIGTQTEARRRFSSEAPDDSPTQPRPRLFRRHSTGSDVYSFSTSPTLLTAFGGTRFGNRGFLTGCVFPDASFSRRSGNSGNNRYTSPNDRLTDTDDEVESVGQQLRKIGDDLDRGVEFRSRSLSLSRFLVDVRRRTSSSSS